MRLDSWLISIVVFSVIMAGGILVFGNVINNYDVNVNNSELFGDVYNKINETYELSQDMKNKTLGAEVEGSDQSWESLIKGGYGATRIVKQSFELVGSILEAIIGKLGVPTMFFHAAMSALTIAIIFAVIYMVFRWSPR